MVTSTVDLDGPHWLVREALGLTWQWYAGVSLPGDVAANNAAEAAAAVTAQAVDDVSRVADDVPPGWLPATVPGSVVTDLWRAREVPDPYVARQSRSAEWVATRSWVHRRAVDVPALRPGERAVLELDGVDPGGLVVWDGVVVGRVDGLYRRLRFDLTPHLPVPTRAGRHRLAIVVDPVPDSQPQVGRTELVRVHAPRMSYGWDFCPRLPHQGIWRSVRIVVGAVLLAHVSVRTELVGDDGRVHVTADVEARAGTRLDVTLTDPDGVPVAEGTCPAQTPQLTLAVRRPRRWWPRGYGDQPLYGLTVRAIGPDGETATWRRAVGFRELAMMANPGAQPAALPYTAVVNGRPIELLGWNWVPVDVQYGTVRTAKVEHLLDLAVESGACVIRVWGGGLVESEELYAACDRRGLLVWQELSQSSSGMQSAPATDAAFVAHMREQATVVVPPLTHHPSLLLWCGGNELDAGGVPLDEETSPVLAALRAEVARLDPGRHWVPTSPSGPEFHHRVGAGDGQHDVHGPWEHQGLAGHAERYDGGTCLAHTEFGVEGMTNERALDALLPPAQQWPTGRENPAMRHLGEWWDNAPLVQESFGGRLTSVAQVRRASQLLQATGLAYAVEADRRRAPRCSMVLPWQLNESYPNAWCTSAVDHRGDAKPVLHAVGRAFAPDRVVLQATTTAWGGRGALVGAVWVWSRDGVAAGSQVMARLCDSGGAILIERRWTVEEAVRHPLRVGEVEVPLARLPADAVLVWELTWCDRADGPVRDHELVLATTATDLSPLLDLEPAVLAVDIRAGDAAGRADGAVRPDDADRCLVRVRHVSGPVVVGLQLVDARELDAPGWAVVAGDPRPLLPGTERTFPLTWRGDVPTDERRAVRRVRLEGWNITPQVLTGPATTSTPATPTRRTSHDDD